MKRDRIPTIDIGKYGGKKVVLMGGKIVASGRSTVQVLERARKLVPKERHRELWLFTVPRGLTMIYRLP